MWYGYIPNLYSLCSQIERELISTRTKDALAKKKKDGVIIGRPSNKMILDGKVEEIKKSIDDSVKLKVIVENYNSQTTITKSIKKHKLKR